MLESKNKNVGLCEWHEHFLYEKRRFYSQRGPFQLTVSGVPHSVHGAYSLRN